MTRWGPVAAEGVRSAFRHPVRSLLTAATSAVAIAVTVNVISLVYGLDEDLQRDASRFGRRTIDVVRIPLLRPGLEREPLGEAERGRILEVLGSMDVLVVARRVAASPAQGARRMESAQLVAAPPAYLRTLDVPVAAGRWLQAEDTNACVLDGASAAALFPGQPPQGLLGRAVLVGETAAQGRYRVVGVLEDPLTHRALFESLDESRGARALASSLLSFRNVYLPAGALTGDEYSAISVVPAAERDIAEVARRLRTIWPADPETFMPKRSVGVIVRREWMELFSGASRTGAFLSNIVWMIIVAVAIVMLSTLNLLTIRERYDELAIRRVEGARRGDVALQVTAEGVLLSLAGGVAGLPVGFVGAALLRRIVDFPFRFELEYAVLATGVSILLGLFASVLPARHAASLQPVKVLTRRRT